MNNIIRTIWHQLCNNDRHSERQGEPIVLQFLLILLLCCGFGMNGLSSTQTAGVNAALAALSLALTSVGVAHAQTGPDHIGGAFNLGTRGGVAGDASVRASPRKIARKAQLSSVFAPDLPPITSIVAPHSPLANRPLARRSRRRSTSFTAAELSPPPNCQVNRSPKSRWAPESVRSLGTCNSTLARRTTFIRARRHRLV